MISILETFPARQRRAPGLSGTCRLFGVFLAAILGLAVTTTPLVAQDAGQNGGAQAGAEQKKKKKRPVLTEDEAKEQLKDLKKQFAVEQQQFATPQRFGTIRDIGDLGTVDAHKFLIQALEREKDSDVPELVWSYCRSLAEFPTAESLQYLLLNAFDILNPTYHSMLVDKLTPLAGHDNEAAIEWLVTRGWKSMPRMESDRQMQVLKVLAGTDDPRLTRPAHEFLGNRKFDPAIQVEFIRLLRRYSAHTDQKTKSRAAKKVAKAFKRTKDRELEVEALLALEALSAAEYSDVFLDALKSQWWQVRSVAVDILVATHQQELNLFITPLLKDPEPSVQVAAVAALRQLGGADAIPPLIDALEKNSGRVTDDIADALVWLTGVDYGIDVLGWRDWWENNKDTTTVKGITQEEFDRIKAEEESEATGTYYGLRIISKYVIFIIDTSASMDEKYRVDTDEIGKGDGGTEVRKKKRRKKKRSGKVMKKIEVARLELVRALNALASGTMFNIIRFSGDFSPWQKSLVRMGEHIRTEAIAHAENVGSGGMTNVYDTLLEALKDPDVNTIYFLSDGAPTAGTTTDSKKILEDIKELNRARKVKIHTIGFHLDPNAKKLMKDLAEQNFGRYVDR